MRAPAAPRTKASVVQTKSGGALAKPARAKRTAAIGPASAGPRCVTIDKAGAGATGASGSSTPAAPPPRTSRRAACRRPRSAPAARRHHCHDRWQSRPRAPAGRPHRPFHRPRTTRSAPGRSRSPGPARGARWMVCCGSSRVHLAARISMHGRGREAVLAAIDGQLLNRDRSSHASPREAAARVSALARAKRAGGNHFAWSLLQRRRCPPQV